MLPPLTPAVTRAIESARRLARARSSAVILPLHLLMGLLEEEEGQAFTLAVAAGMAREAVAAWAVRPADPVPEVGDVPLADLVQRLLRQARELAAELTGESTVSSEVVLLALLRGD